MKNMNMKKRYWTMNLQVFAGDGGDDDPGDEGGDDDDEPGDDDDDSDDDDEPEENEKKFSQKDVDDAVKKRLAREKENGRENSRKRLERNRTVRSRPERVARKKMMILKHRSSVIRLPRQMRWR